MLPRGLAPLLVFVASGAVLVLEILGVRLLAPYVGLTLETYTTIIGVVLAGIAIGAAAGGRAADRVPARPLLALLLAGGGLLALLTVPLVRVLGEAFEGAGTASAMALALFALLPPATVLSAVTPVVVKLELGDLAASGTVVGRLSGWATAGALAGTFATGFVLVPLLPVRATVIGIGALLVLAGLAVGLLFRALPGGTALAVAGAAALLAAVAALSGSRCQTESVYFCANVVADPDRPAGRTLMLDDLRHSYVDLRDPRHLEFAYTRWMGDAIDAMRPPGEPLDAVFVGGGGFTLPRYLAATRPGSHSRVLEVDQQLVDLARAELGLRTGPDLRVEVGDARVTLRGEPGGSADLVVGDAFGGRSVPVAPGDARVRRRHPARPAPRRDLPAQRDRLRRPRPRARRGGHAARRLRRRPARRPARPGGRQPRADRLGAAAPRPRSGPSARGARTLDRAAVRRFAGDAAVLTDDDAPADQLLTAGT